MWLIQESRMDWILLGKTLVWGRPQAQHFWLVFHYIFYSVQSEKRGSKTYTIHEARSDSTKKLCTVFPEGGICNISHSVGSASVQSLCFKQVMVPYPYGPAWYLKRPYIKIFWNAYSIGIKMFWNLSSIFLAPEQHVRKACKSVLFTY